LHYARACWNGVTLPITVVLDTPAIVALCVQALGVGQNSVRLEECLQ